MVNYKGVSGTNVDSMQNGALGDILKIISGSSSNAAKAQNFANQLYPDVPKADPYEIMFKYFIDMGQRASKPGATVLGSAVGAMQAPMDYLNAKKKEKVDTDRARAQTALSLAPSLKPPKATGSGTSVKVVGPDGKPRFMSTAEAIRTGAEPYIAPTSGKANDLKPFGLINSADLDKIKRVIPTASVDANGNVLLTDVEAAMDGVRPFIGQKITPTSPSSSSAETEIAKLYDDLGNAKDQADEAAKKFLLDNPTATTEEISDAAQNNPLSAEIQTLQEQINSLAAASGFNKEIFTAESGLRKEWQNLKNPFQTISAGHKKLIASLKAQTGVGDMSAIFAYMKMLDENSVVRESEFQSAQSTSGLYQSLLTKYNQLKQGNMLSPVQREEFMNLANKFYKVTEQFIDKNRLDLGITVLTYPTLNPMSIFGGSELAPNSFYSDVSVFRVARDTGFTMDEVWKAMTAAEKAVYLPSGG